MRIPELNCHQTRANEVYKWKLKEMDLERKINAQKLKLTSDKTVRRLVVGKHFIRFRSVCKTQIVLKTKFQKMGINKLKNIKDPEVLLRKAVLINNSIHFLHVHNTSKIGSSFPADDKSVTEDDMDEDILSEISFPPPLSPLDDISCKIFNTDKIVRESNHNDPPVNLANYNIADILSELELPPLLSPLEDCFEPFEDVECILKDEIDDKQVFDDIERAVSGS